LKKLSLLLVISISLILCACELDDDGTPTVQNELDRAVERVRLALETKLNKKVPSLSVLIETPDASYFTSSIAQGAEGGTFVLSVHSFLKHVEHERLPA